MNSITVVGKLIDKPVFYEGPIGRGFSYFKVNGWRVSPVSFLEEGASSKKEKDEFHVIAYGYILYSVLKKFNPGDGMLIRGDLQKDYARYKCGVQIPKANPSATDGWYETIRFISLNEDCSIDPIKITEKDPAEDSVKKVKPLPKVDLEKLFAPREPIYILDEELPF